ncbi:hypothetical protein HZC34_03855 [Candidatus Saganbacteria bacterium]|nr:hypothetical protein [Candidatus Saganbacteria bacterium]
MKRILGSMGLRPAGLSLFSVFLAHQRIAGIKNSLFHSEILGGAVDIYAGQKEKDNPWENGLIFQESL